MNRIISRVCFIVLEAVSKPFSERGTVPFSSADSAKGDSPRTVLKLLLLSSLGLSPSWSLADEAGKAQLKRTVAESANPEASNRDNTDAQPGRNELGAADAKTAVLRLSVVDDDDAPVPNAKISVRTFTTGGAWPAVSRFECDDQGKLDIELPKQTPRYFVVHVEKPGHAPFYAGWEPQGTSPDPVPESYTVRLDPGQLIGGVVQDEDGKPIVGAKVRPQFNLKMREERTHPLGASTNITTDAEGRWTYASFPADLRQVAIGVTHPEYAATRVTEQVAEFALNEGTTPGAAIKMKRGIVLQGQVTDPDGGPIAGANVVYYQLSSGERPSAHTDQGGNYRIANGVAGDTFATASAAGWAPAIKSVRIEPTMGGVDFQLAKGHPLMVRVVDSNGKPLDGVQVTLLTWGDHKLHSTLPGGRGNTDAEGKWAWEHAPEGSIRFAFYKDGYSYIRDQELTPSDEENLVTMTPEAASERQVLKVSGRVIDAKTKKPIAKFRVIPGDQRQGSAISWHNFKQSESRNGEYRKDFTPNMTTSKKHVLRVEADGYVPATSRVFDTDEREVTIDFALEPGKGFVVLTPDGQPAKHAEIGICTSSSGPYIDDGIISPNSTAERISANDEGRFNITPREGVYGLVVLHETGAAFAIPDQLRESNTIQLAPFARLKGTLRIRGKPAADELVTVSHRSDRGHNRLSLMTGYEATTDKDGTFVVERLLPGTVQVSRVVRSDLGDGVSRMLTTHWAEVQLDADETARLDLSREGPLVVGKLVVPERVAKQNDWRLATAKLSKPRVPLPPPPKPPLPDGIDFEKDRDAAKWWNEWKDTAEGLHFQAQRKTWQEMVHRLQAIPSPSYDAKVESDGSFVFEDIPPGDYQLQVVAQSRPENGPPLGGNTIARLEQGVTIDAPSEGEDQVDLGELQLQ